MAINIIHNLIIGRNYQQEKDKIMMRLRIQLILQPLRHKLKGFSKVSSKAMYKSTKFIIFSFFMMWGIHHSKVKMAVTDQNVQQKSQARAQKVPQQIFNIPDDIRQRVNKHRMILVMDLDETMVFTRRKRTPGHENFRALNVNGAIVYVQYRPHIGEFLAAVSQIFTIYVYTAGTKPYADAVLDSLPNSHVIEKRFYRDSCVIHKGTLIKDLKIIHSSFNQQPHEKLAILVDDNSLSIMFNQPHSVRIRAFEGNQQDRHLKQIFAHLMDYYRQYSTPPAP